MPKEYNARGERMYENPIKRENAKKTEKINKNKMKKTKASVGAVPTQVEVIRKKTFEKIFEKMRRVKVMEIDIQKRENDFFWEYVQKPISTQEERDDRDILKRAAYLGFADEWRVVFQEWDEIAEISTDIRELAGAQEKKNDAEKFAKWKEILEKIKKKNKNTV